MCHCLWSILLPWSELLLHYLVCRCLGNFVSGDDTHTQHVLDHGVIGVLKDLLVGSGHIGCLGRVLYHKCRHVAAVALVHV